MKPWCALLAVTVLATTACGSSDLGVEGAGGQVGQGGSGGQGGDAGQGGNAGQGGDGGSAGSEDLCGNGELDDGEACDDGNRQSGDGCSDSCTWEGTCEVPLDFMELAQEVGGQFDLEGLLPDRDGFEEGSCSTETDGPELVYFYRAPAAGQLSVAVGAEDRRVVSYVRSSCSDGATQVSCRIEGGLHRVTLAEGEEAFLVVDAPADLTSRRFILSAVFDRFRGEGEPCGGNNLCGEGLVCENRQCEAIRAPDLHDAVALRGGAGDLIVIAEGADQVGNAVLFDVRFLDARGEPIEIDADEGWRWRPETRTLQWRVDHREPIRTSPGVPFRAWATIPDVLSRHPEVQQVAISLVFSKAASNEMLVRLGEQPVRAKGEACSFPEPADRCAEDLLCWSQGEGRYACEDITSLRRQSCLGAPLLEGAGSITGARSQRSLWDPPSSCWDPSTPEHMIGYGQVESVVRLSLADDASRVRISTDTLDTQNGSILYVFEGCGEIAEPLACDHRTAPQFLMGSQIILEDVPAGDYLIVIDSSPGGALHPAYGLEVTIE